MSTKTPRTPSVQISKPRYFTWKFRSIYARLIVELTGCTREEAPAVELFMRDKYGTLDNIDRATFKREAKACLKVVRKDPEFARDRVEKGY